MKKSSCGKRGPQDSVLPCGQPEKTGWIRKFCGRGIFREIWRNRFVVLRGDQLFICEKEVKEPGRADEVLDLTDFDRCEELRKKKKSRSKKNHSRFRLQRCSSSSSMVPNLVFLAVSPEEKESWINALNAAITRAKNRILDEVTVEDAQLCHLTRDRVKIPQHRRLPTRGHLLAVASTSSSDGALTLDLIQEEDPPSIQAADGRNAIRAKLDQSQLGPDCPRSKTDSALCAWTAEDSGKSQSLPREVVAVWEQTGSALTPRPDQLTTAASMDQISTRSETRAAPTSPAPPLAATRAAPVERLQRLISQKLERTEQLLLEARGQEAQEAQEAGRLLREAAGAWTQAKEVLQEVQELRALYQELDSGTKSSL
ncbi:uncharacterized protein V6R79_021726 [Siganus canaliculatus]